MAERSLSLEVDLEHGGRWTSLLTSTRPAGHAAQTVPGPPPLPDVGGTVPVRAGREWLWRRPEAAAARTAVRPGGDFVDAGGVEECFPSVAGRWDHGDVWSRRWRGGPSDAVVATLGWDLRRRVSAAAPAGLRVRYSLRGPVGQGVLHAVHGLYALSDRARIEVAAGTPMRVQDVAGDGGWTTGDWPGDGLDRCGPADGTARLAVVATDRVRLVDGAEALELRWARDRGSGPVSLLLWRNLGGWPAEGPYRSIGVEPMLGAATDVDLAEPDQLARPDPDGWLAWTLSITALPAPPDHC